MELNSRSFNSSIFNLKRFGARIGKDVWCKYGAQYKPAVNFSSPALHCYSGDKK